jgi:uncharacterized integral membrane protein
MQILMVWLKRVLIVSGFTLVAAYVLFFTLNNTEHVNIDFLFIEWLQVPVELALVAAFIAGGLSGVMFTCVLWLRLKNQLKLAQAALIKSQR